MTSWDGELAALLEQFDAFTARVRARLIAGHARYGDAWRRQDNLAALLEECEDAYAYGFLDWLKAHEHRARRLRVAAACGEAEAEDEVPG